MLSTLLLGVAATIAEDTSSGHCDNCGAASTQRICARCLQNRLCRGCRRYLPKHCFFESSVLCEVRLSLFIEIRFCIDTEVRCVRAHPPFFDPLSRRGLNPIKPVYDPDRPDGRLNLTASAFNYLGQYTNSPGRRGATAMQNSPFSSPTVVVTIASTREGMGRLSWPRWLVT